MNSADPHGKACGAVISGHSLKNPDSGLAAQSPLPPAQPLNPLEISLTPMSMTVGPVTIGGKIRFKTFGGVKERAISRRAQRHEVPGSVRIVYPPWGHVEAYQ